MEGLTHLLDREAEPASGEDAPGLSQSPPGAEDRRPASPYGAQPISGGGHKEDRQQTFLQVKSNREARLGARVSRCKRIRSSLDDQVECPLPRGSRAGEAEDELSEGSRCGDDEYQALGKSFLGMKGGRLQATPCSSSSRDSDGDLDSEGEDDPPKYLLCPLAPKDPLGREEGAGGRAEDQATLSSLEILQAQVRELTHRLLRTDAYKCHICLDSYSVPLASIQCWHIHCELCWLRTLGSKKLCPQCNTITSPADLRRVYL
ncbi:E3 ubiquitin-protein ligase Rnf220-like isoform X2 [Tachyglossus aculeatus]|nr:E3 ubiquitin-protein ligase Rnf220-like isoform X2 [Tachyglossus aculeatus]